MDLTWQLYKHSLMKSSSPQMLSCTVILLVNFSFGLINFVNLSTTFFIQSFFNVFYFFHKNAFLTFFILEVNVFLHLCTACIYVDMYYMYVCMCVYVLCMCAYVHL